MLTDDNSIVNKGLLAANKLTVNVKNDFINADNVTLRIGNVNVYKQEKIFDF
ncbi:MAG: hypothetical protein ACL7BU_16070 [Candidatus Phlomobacter fragariae]